MKNRASAQHTVRDHQKIQPEKVIETTTVNAIEWVMMSEDYQITRGCLSVAKGMTVADCLHQQGIDWSYYANHKDWVISLNGKRCREDSQIVANDQIYICAKAVDIHQSRREMVRRQRHEMAIQRSATKEVKQNKTKSRKQR